jgi:hypothetical protein
MATYLGLPLEVLYTIKTFTTNTRVDWRTCKKREASLIRSLEGGSVLGQDQDLLDWTLYGRLYMEETLELYPAFGAPGFLSLREPPPMEDFRRWYLLQYRWLRHTGKEENRWVYKV